MNMYLYNIQHTEKYSATKKRKSCLDDDNYKKSEWLISLGLTSYK